MSITLASSTGTVTLSDPAANFEATVGAYWDAHQPEGPDYGVQDVLSPGMEMSSVLLGFRGRNLALPAWYIASTYIGCWTAVLADEAKLYNQPVVISDGTNSLPALYALPYKPDLGPVKTGYSTYMLHLIYFFRQKRTS